MNVLELLRLKNPDTAYTTFTKSRLKRDNELRELRKKHPGLKQAWMFVNKLTKENATTKEISVAEEEYNLLLALTGWDNGITHHKPLNETTMIEEL